MKGETGNMKRRSSRENAFLAEFELSFEQTSLNELLETWREDGEIGLDQFAEHLLRLVESNAGEINELIRENLKGWSSERLSKVSISLLRLAVAEMLYGEPDMDSIIINEAVELAKKYAGDKDYQFINGVLGTISRQKHPSQTAEEA